MNTPPEIEADTDILRWTKAEQRMVARRYAQKFGAAKPTAKTLKECQDDLPADRRKVVIGHLLVKRLRVLIEEASEQEASMPEADEDTTRVHTGFYDRLTNGNGVELPPVVPMNGHRKTAIDLPKPKFQMPEPVRLPLPIERTVAVTVHGDSSRVVDILVDINLATAKLDRVTAGELREAAGDQLNAGRLRNLIRRASDALTFFEELLHVA